MGGMQDAARVKSRHRQAMEMMLSNVDAPLTVYLLRRIHAVLMDDEPTISNLRTTNSRCGHQEWCPGARVKVEMDAFVAEANRLLVEGTLGESKHEKRTALRRTALLAVGLVQIHPFSDGNGRVMRILCNLVLRKAGVPFTICLCSTEAQRSTLVRACISAHNGDDIGPMVSLLGELLENAWSELQRLHETRTKSSADAAQSHAIKRARDEARARSCMICLEDAAENPPNIATLCCGSAVHLNCLAEWLSSADEPSCVQCRAALPKPKPRPAPPAAAAAAAPGADSDDETSTTTTTESDDDSNQGPLAQSPADPVSDDDETTTTSDSDTVTVSDDGADGTATTDSSAEDTTTLSDDEATTTVDEQPKAHISPPRPMRCTNCQRNQAAPQCMNGCCGCCCVVTGQYSCQRHGT
jgi:fido (protein-threonine AMPylation protein)